MPESFLDGRVLLHPGDCREVLATYPDNHFDSCVTDPPYGLFFMGRGWDKGVPGIDYWKEVFRVLKPGAHLVAFSGTRTYHRMTCAIEDVGFEVRDMLSWIYGSGFPKSLNVSKELDAKRERCSCPKDLRHMRDGLGAAQSETGGPKENLQPSLLGVDDFASQEGRNQEASHSVPVLRDNNEKPAAVQMAQTAGCLLQPILSRQNERDSSAPVCGEYEGAKAQGQAVRDSKFFMEGGCDLSQEAGELRTSQIRPVSGGPDLDGTQGRVCDGAQIGDGALGWSGSDQDGMCAPYGPQAAQQRTDQPGIMAVQSEPQGGGTWAHCRGCGKPVIPDGIGTALKPALEPVCVARKPIEEDTVAYNVLKWGTGAINIGVCRVEAAGESTVRWSYEIKTSKGTPGGAFGNADRQVHLSDVKVMTGGDEGRWPANILHDGSADVVDAFPVVNGGKSGDRGLRHSGRFGGLSDLSENLKEGTDGVRGYDDPAGSAARFFTEIKPDLEPACVARKPLSEDTVAANVLVHGTGGLNVDGCRVGSDTIKTQAKRGMHGTGSADKMRELGYRPYRIDNRDISDTYHEGRWPANVVHDGSVEVVDGFPDSEVSGSAKNGRPSVENKSRVGVTSFMATKGDGVKHNDSGSASRFFYQVKPDLEPACLARKPLAEDTVAENVLNYGTGGLNVDACRVEYVSDGDKRPDTRGLNHGSSDRGFGGLSPEAVLTPADGAGRWPANVVHDGSAEVVKEFPEVTSHGGGTSNTGFWSRDDRGQPIAKGDSGSASRFFYQVKPDMETACLARKPLADSTVAENVVKHGTGGLNVDGCRVEAADQDRLAKNWDREKFYDMSGGKFIGGINSGINLTSEASALGRWPANVVHDGSAEVKEAFPESKGQCGAVTGKEPSSDKRPIFSRLKGRYDTYLPRDDSGSAARFFYDVKPDLEPACLARKPLAEDTVAANVLEHGTGGLNVDACRVETQDDLNGGAYGRGRNDNRKRVEYSLGDKGEGAVMMSRLKNGLGEFDHPGGRWPANVVHDGSAEVVEAFPETESHGGGTSNTGFWSRDDRGQSIAKGDSGSAGRFFYEVKPDMDAACVARKPLSEDTVAANVVKHGCGGLNIEGARVGDEKLPALKGGQAQIGTFIRSMKEGTGVTPEREGRWPANVAHDGSPEVVNGFPETTSGTLASHHKNAGGGLGGSDTFKIRDRTGEDRHFEGNSGSASRFFYTAKAGNDDRLGSTHPTVKPVDLMQWLIRLTTRKGGLVLEPFAGTGTTGEAAYREGMRCVLIEMDEKSCQDIRNRMALVNSSKGERKRATVKAKVKSGRVKIDEGPLFAGLGNEANQSKKEAA